MRKLTLSAMLLLTACSVGPDFAMPNLELPTLWSHESAVSTATTPIPLDWWKLFNDPILTALEEEGQKANADTLLAAARVAQARAQLGLSEANQYPQLDAQGGANRTSRSKESATNPGGSAKPYNDFSVAAVLSYEVDLWGKLRRASESARAQLLSTQANRDAVALAVASDIASGYFNLLALDAQIAVTKQTIATRQSSEHYQASHYKHGAIDALSYRQAEAELAQAQAVLPGLEQAQVEQQNALSILLGRSPHALVERPIARGKALSALPVPPAIPADLPSSLLTRRPDIAAAQQDMVAANADIGVATAAYFPSLSLSALIGLDSQHVDNLLKSSARNWMLGGSLAAPILDAGRTRANVDAAKARNDAAIITYQQVVRSAFAEALNAMSAVRTSEVAAAAQTRQVTARRDAARIAARRYDAGYSTQLERLDTDRALFQSQLDQIQSTRDRLSASVTLYKALGGGWTAADKVQGQH
ncbi:MAG: efflux transporter outer membrane subunit [Pseudomonadota bacterium]